MSILIPVLLILCVFLLMAYMVILGSAFVQGYHRNGITCTRLNRIMGLNVAYRLGEYLSEET